MIRNSTYVYWPEQCKQCVHKEYCENRDRFENYLDVLVKLNESCGCADMCRIECTCDKFEIGYNIYGGKV